jgi:hypothetical protein
MTAEPGQRADPGMTFKHAGLNINGRSSMSKALTAGGVSTRGEQTALARTPPLVINAAPVEIVTTGVTKI